MKRYAHITSCGMAVPERVFTNQDLEKMVDTTDEWIISRTGIHERHIASPQETTASLATAAALNALDPTPLDPDDVQLIIVASATPEHIFPATACIVQDNIGAVNAGAFDLSAACTGFIFAVNMAAQAIRSGSIDNAIVIGSETLSKIVNWEDRNTCVLFGDGAGAFVLQASEIPGGVLSCVMRSDGSGGDLLSVPAGGSQMPTTMETVAHNLHTIQMNGREVFRFATREMAAATREAVAIAQLQLDDINLIVPHQANRRIIETAARSLRVPMDRIIMNIDRYGNTSTASIPIAVCEAMDEGRIQSEDNLVLVGFGAGLTWGAMVIRCVETEVYVAPTRRARRRFLFVLARLRSFVRRVLRKLEGLIWSTSSKK
ncbi:MAG: beta-ketoacyl-ACP synthase III [Anaerolineales bacterium]|nr:beta-ketoacyl-ACP synthase III [Anaerolineales bacterium]